MTKAKTKFITLDARSETKKGNAPKTGVQQAAAEIGRLWEMRNQFEDIERASRKLITEDDRESRIIFQGLATSAASLDNISYEQTELLKETILLADPKDATDALIMALVFANEFETSEDWISLAAQTGTDKEEQGYIELYTAEHAKHARILNNIIRGLCRGLGVSPHDLGLGSFYVTAHDWDFNESAAALLREAGSQGICGGAE